MNRRTFLTLGAAVAISPALPSMGMGPIAPMPPTMPYPAFAVGTPGEWNWRVFFARDEERAKALYLDEWGDDDPGIEARPVPHLPNAAEEGDHHPSVADCLEMGWGHHCSRHHDEVSPDEYIDIDGDAVCFECIAPQELSAHDHADFVDNLVNDQYDLTDPEIIALLRPEDLLNPLVIEALADAVGMG